MSTGHKELLVRFFKFGIVGGSGVVVNLGIYFLLTRCFGLLDSLWGKYAAYAFSVEISIITNYLLNDVWTFADRRETSSWLRRFFRFHVVSLVGMAINWGVFAVLNWLMAERGLALLGQLSVLGWEGNLDDLLAACLGIVAAMAWNFSANLIWTWKGD
jgi:dolichol-phosphate mannosyltransferase